MDINNEDFSFKAPKSLAQSIADHIEKEIIEGKLQPGFRLNPEELSDRFKVSKSPIREALMSLQGEGLVINKTRIGFFVTDIDIEDIEEIYPIRAVLNSLMIESIINNEYNQEFINKIEKTLKMMEQAVVKEDANEYFQYSSQFFNHISDYCQNGRLKTILSQLGKQVIRLRRMGLGKPGRIQESLALHKELVKAIKDNNAKLAGKVSKDIVYAGLQALRELF